jgi:hypothetical protein
MEVLPIATLIAAAVAASLSLGSGLWAQREARRASEARRKTLDGLVKAAGGRPRFEVTISERADDLFAIEVRQGEHRGRTELSRQQAERLVSLLVRARDGALSGG